MNPTSLAVKVLNNSGDPAVVSSPPTLSRIAVHAAKPWVQYFFLALAGILVRAPALQGQFLWDDDFLARANPFIKSPLLILEAFRHYLFPDSYASHYRPVQNISFIFDYYFWNNNPYGFHLTNLALHVASGLLLFVLLRGLFRSLRPASSAISPGVLRAGAFFVALLWMVHPVQSAAVDYISGRADSLAFLFACGGWLLVRRAQMVERTPLRVLLYGVATLCGLLALCSREIAGIWLALFLLHRFLFEKTLPRRAQFVSLGICIALCGIYLGLRQLPERRPGGGPSESFDGATRAVLMLRALGDYGRLMVFPGNLHMERTVFDPANYRSPQSWRAHATTEYLSILGALVLAALSYGAARPGAARSIRILGATWFFLGFLPISNVVDLGATVAEHWLYLPSVGLLIFAAGCVLDLPIRFRKLSVALASVAVIALGARSFVRSGDWLSPEIFYQRTLAAGGVSTRVVANLARIYGNQQEDAKAEAMYRRVLQIDPNYPVAQNNLAEVLYREGKTKEAKQLFALTSADAGERRKEYPRTWMAALNLARVLHHEEKDQAALALLEKAARDFPRTWEIISLESELLRQAKGPDAALPIIQQFAQNNWWHYGAALALGRLLAEKGEVEKAYAALRHASRLDVHDAEALNLIAMMDVRQDRLEDARATQGRAIARQPNEPRQYVMLGSILEKMGRTAESHAATATAARLTASVEPDALAN